jgi:hypothetical protein
MSLVSAIVEVQGVANLQHFLRRIAPRFAAENAARLATERAFRGEVDRVGAGKMNTEYSSKTAGKNLPSDAWRVHETMISI